MNDELKTHLRSIGRPDLVDIYEATQEGYAGIQPDGSIVDRRLHPHAIAIPENIRLGVPKPKEL